MTNTSMFLSKIRSLLAIAALGLGSLAAHAGLVSYNFTVVVDNTGPLANQAYTGSFTYDDASSTAFGGDTLFALTAFNFSFNNVSYDLGDLSFGDAVFQGPQFAGLDVGGPVFSFLPGAGNAAPYFAFDTGNDAGNGAVSFQAVPEPGSIGLVLAGLALVGAARRTRAASQTRRA